MPTYLQINGHKAEVFSRNRFFLALNAEGRLLENARPEVVEAARLTPALVRDFAARVGAAGVTFVDQVTFAYSTPCEMSFTRGTREREVRYSAAGEVLSRTQKMRGY